MTLYRWIKRLFGFRRKPIKVINTVYPLRGLSVLEERLKATRKT